MLRVCQLTQTLGKKTILHEVSCSFELGQVTALLGPNGAGKTTLLKSILGLVKNPPVQKESQCIEWNKSIINNLPTHTRIAQGIAYLPQMSALFHELSSEKNLTLIYENHPYWKGKKKEIFSEEVEFWVNEMNLTKIKNQHAGTLSGGQKRKLEIIRSILMHPQLLLCDEPFAGVDPKSIYELKQIFSMLAKQGVGVVISDHHVDQLLTIANYVYVILHGSVIAKGTTIEILNNKQTQDHYLGYQFHREMSEKFSG